MSISVPTPIPDFTLREASETDAPLLLEFIRELAEYERLSHEVVATESLLREHLFGARPAAEAVIGFRGDEPVGFALYFSTFSTFVGRPGMYLEDVFIRPRWRGQGFGRAMLAYVARLAVRRGCGRLEWSVLDWNEPALGLYRSLGAVPMDEWTVQRLSGEAIERVASEFDRASGETGLTDFALPGRSGPAA